MGINIILPLIMGIAMTVIIGSQVVPSYIEKIKIAKVENQTINNQEVIFEGVQRFITMKQRNPVDLREVVEEGFLNEKVIENGFGGEYTIKIEETKGLLKVRTFIEDKTSQETFLNSFKNKFKPIQIGTNEFETTFVIPMDVMHGSGLFMTGIPMQTNEPDKNKYKYWYDTNGEEAILKISDGDKWIPISKGENNNKGNGSTSINKDDIVVTNDDLWNFNDAKEGDIKYAYDDTTKSIQEYVYYKNRWTAKNYNGVAPLTDGEKYYKYLRESYPNLFSVDVNNLNFGSSGTTIDGTSYQTVSFDIPKENGEVLKNEIIAFVLKEKPFEFFKMRLQIMTTKDYLHFAKPPEIDEGFYMYNKMSDFLEKNVRNDDTDNTFDYPKAKNIPINDNPLSALFNSLDIMYLSKATINSLPAIDGFSSVKSEFRNGDEVWMLFEINKDSPIIPIIPNNRDYSNPVYKYCDSNFNYKFDTKTQKQFLICTKFLDF